MTNVIAAFLAAILSAAPAYAEPNPTLDAAEYDKAYQLMREKAKAAYLAPSPIAEAVTPDDLKKLAPTMANWLTPERQKKAAEFADAVKAAKTLQGAPDQPVLAPAEKTRLMQAVYKGFGLTGADQSKAIGTYLPSVMAPAPFAKAPPESVLKEAKARQDASAARTAAVMKGDLGIGPSAVGGTPAGGAPQAGPSPRPNERMSASEFRPSSKLGALGKDVPSLDHAADEKKTGLVASVVGALKTPLPGLDGAKEKFAGYAKEKMARSAELEQEGAAKLAKGGFWNTVDAAGLSVNAWSQRVRAMDKETVENVALAVGGTALVVGAVIAAPVVIAAAGAVSVGLAAGSGTVMVATAAGTAVATTGTAMATAGAITIGSSVLTTAALTYGSYSTANSVGAIVREPDYANAAGLALGFVGAKYAGPIASKAEHLAEKVAVAAISRKGAAVAAETTVAAGAASVATPILAKGAAPIVAEAAVAVEATVAKTALQVAGTVEHAAVKAGGEAMKEGVHEGTKITLHAALPHNADHGAPHGDAPPTRMAKSTNGPFPLATLPMAAGGH